MSDDAGQAGDGVLPDAVAGGSGSHPGPRSSSTQPGSSRPIDYWSIATYSCLLQN